MIIPKILQHLVENFLYFFNIILPLEINDALKTIQQLLIYMGLSNIQGKDLLTVNVFFLVFDLIL